MTNKITGYSFGQVAVDGQQFTNDLIVFPDEVKSGWWRREGHLLQVEDLGAVVDQGIEVLVVGTGASGGMSVASGVGGYLTDKGIKLVAKETGEAVEIFNRLLAENRAVAAALHLTC